MLIVLASCFFSTSGPLASAVMSVGLSPQQVASARICLAAVVLLVGAAVIRPRVLRIRRASLPLVLAYGVVGVTGVQLLYFFAVSRLPVGIAMLLEFLSPVLVTVWVRVVRRTVLPRAIWLGVAIALGGLALVAQVWQSGTLNTVGVLIGLADAACAAAYFLLGERGVSGDHPVGVAAWGLLVGAVVMAAICPPWTIPAGQLVRTVPLGRWHPVIWLVLLAIALVSTVLAYVAGVAALRHLPSSVVSVLGLLEPVVATATAWALLGQSLSAAQLVGGVLLLTGASIVQLTTRRPATGEPVPVTERQRVG